MDNLMAYLHTLHSQMGGSLPPAPTISHPAPATPQVSYFMTLLLSFPILQTLDLVQLRDIETDLETFRDLVTFCRISYRLVTFCRIRLRDLVTFCRIRLTSTKYFSFISSIIDLESYRFQSLLLSAESVGGIKHA